MHLQCYQRIRNSNAAPEWGPSPPMSESPLSVRGTTARAARFIRRTFRALLMGLTKCLSIKLSAPNMPGDYVLRLLFDTPAGTISGLESPVTESLDGLRFTLSANREARYELRVDGFDSNEDALRFIPRVWLGLVWLLLNRHIPFAVSLDPLEITYAKDPVAAAKNLGLSVGRVDGLVSGEGPIVQRKGQEIRRLTMGQATLSVSTPASLVLPFLKEGLGTRDAEQLFQDNSLRTAVDLYSGQFSERSLEGRLLTLSMALEVLAPKIDKHPIALKLLTELQQRILQLRNSGGMDGDEEASLEALERELLFRREASIRSRIRSLAVSVGFGTAEEKQELVRSALRAYDARSVLLHEGRLDPQKLSRAHEDAQAVIRAVFRSRLEPVVRPTGLL